MPQYIRQGGSESELVQVVNRHERILEEELTKSLGYFGAIGDGVANDTSALQSAFDWLQESEGRTVHAGDGTYRITSTIYMGDFDDHSIKYQSFICDGTIKADGNFDAIHFAGRLNSFRCKRITGSTSNTSYGLKVVNGESGRVSVDIIEYFKYPIAAVGRGRTAFEYGTQYTSFDIRNLYCNTGGACVYLTTERGDTGYVGWVNECYWHLGRMVGDVGVKTEKGDGQWDPFNGHAFYQCGFENVSVYGSYLDFAKNNAFVFPRYESSRATATFIYETSTCDNNDYFVDKALQITDISLNGKSSRVRGPIYDSEWVRISDGLYQHRIDSTAMHIHLGSENPVRMQNNTLFYRHWGEDLFYQYAGAVKDGAGNVKSWGLLDPFKRQNINGQTGSVLMDDDVSLLEVSTYTGGNITIQMSATREINGFYVVLNVYAYANTITINNSAAVEQIASTRITKEGLFLLTYKSGWFISRIGEYLSQASTEPESGYIYAAQSISGSTGSVTVNNVSYIKCDTSSGGNITLSMPSAKETNGMHVFLDVINYTNTIAVQKSDTTYTLSAGFINSKGLWILIYRDDIWVATKIGYKTLNSHEMETSTTWNPGTVSAGSTVSSSAIAVTQAKVGDFVHVSADQSIQGCTLTGHINSVGYVVITINNNTGGGVTFSSGTWWIKVVKHGT